MSNIDFFILMLDGNMSLYLTCLGIALVVYFILFRKVIKSLFDPLTIALVGSMFCFSVVLFLYLTGSIALFYLSSYLLTQGVFFACFLLLNKTRLSFGSSFTIEKELDFNKIAFFVSSVIFISSTLITYARVGIPMFMTSRLDAAVDGGGWGLLTRLAGVCQFFSLYYCYHFLFNKNLCTPLLRTFSWLVLGCVVIFMALSGAKSAFFIFAIMYFFYAVTQRNSRKNLLVGLRKREPLLVVVALVVAVVVILARGGAGVEEASLEVVQRFVGTGDIFWMAYPNDAMMQISSDNGMAALFGPLLSPIRLMDGSTLPTPIGIDLYQMYYNVDSLMGPNSRHNIFGLLYFGWGGSIIFSATIGLALGFMRSLFANSDFSSLFRTIAICYVYYAFCSIEVDITYVMGELASFILAMPVLIGASTLLFILLSGGKKEPSHA